MTLVSEKGGNPTSALHCSGNTATGNDNDDGQLFVHQQRIACAVCISLFMIML